MPNLSFSLRRLWAMITKELVQMRRDRLTFGMMVGIPLVQLILFGYAINSDPKHLPTAILCNDNSPFARTVVVALKNSDYFKIAGQVKSEAKARQLINLGEVQFVLHIPVDFSRRLVRGEHPSLLLEADATDPSAVANAVTSLNVLANSVLNRDLSGPLAYLKAGPPPFRVIVHPAFNPEAITQYNIVPGLMGVVLTMTMVIITALAVTRERERGTMENLLTTPVRPLEVMLGKLIPYILVGYVQIGLIITMAIFLFSVPILGSVSLLILVSLLFIAANLVVGVTFSTLAKNQLQAMQMAFFFFLPSIMLSGFMFPFRGMPQWAQAIGSALPLTHYLRIVRGILLKGNGLPEVWVHLWPIGVFFLVVLVIGLMRYQKTLD
ncbi:ABC transporter permease [Dethiosulfatarculus sandiegensis]|uniref:Mannose-1-phosphate guanyltransferase n=1 Tax=Dethiosulfatarculus sandiegensis TaxID=1429043 RepID=A0A0D2HUK7_9BACT|nr:ABC transporter permease [Dethiosulfatarculus sandiegensis]KIX14123.1 mannose-1-phosphate guanyltransferase [Dethiosulfatarculus sandiegensis]